MEAPRVIIKENTMTKDILWTTTTMKLFGHYVVLTERASKSGKLINRISMDADTFFSMAADLAEAPEDTHSHGAESHL